VFYAKDELASLAQFSAWAFPPGDGLQPNRLERRIIINATHTMWATQKSG
jgi:hypothetical protein